MASTSETGHYKNVANFKLIKIFIQGLLAAYMPVKESLQIPQVTVLLDEATALHSAVLEQKNTVSIAVDKRQLVFENIKTFCNSIINLLSSMNVSEKTIEDAKAINAKIQGTRLNKTIDENPPVVTSGSETPGSETQAPKTHSVSRQSYDSFYENFKALHNLLHQDGNYLPEEIEFKEAALTAKEAEMLLANENVAIENESLATKRAARNARFYKGDVSLLAVSKGIKKYIRGKFTINSPQFKQVKNFQIRDLSAK